MANTSASTPERSTTSQASRNASIAAPAEASRRAACRQIAAAAPARTTEPRSRRCRRKRPQRSSRAGIEIARLGVVDRHQWDPVEIAQLGVEATVGERADRDDRRALAASMYRVAWPSRTTAPANAAAAPLPARSPGETSNRWRAFSTKSSVASAPNRSIGELAGARRARSCNGRSLRQPRLFDQARDRLGPALLARALPAAVHPQPELGARADVGLERRGVAAGEPLDLVVALALGQDRLRRTSCDSGRRRAARTPSAPRRSR